MKNFCVIGCPIEHSKSPALHEAGFVEMDIDATFEAVEVQPEDLASWVRDELPNYQGVAVTLPHKESIRELLPAETEAASAIGAVNTIYREKDGTFIGTNTDGLGALKALLTLGTSLEGKSVLILGAGGASRAVTFALSKSGADVWVWNRTADKARALAQDMNVNFLEDWSVVPPENIDIVINTTSVGLRKWESLLPEDFWRPTHIAFDIVYEPLETRFLSDAEAAGAQVITGDHMLTYQALEQFRIWHGGELEAEVMNAAFFER